MRRRKIVVAAEPSSERERLSECEERIRFQEIALTEKQGKIQSLTDVLGIKEEFYAKTQEKLDAALEELREKNEEAEALKRAAIELKAKAEGESSCLQQGLHHEQTRVAEKQESLARTEEEVSQLRKSNNDLRTVINRKNKEEEETLNAVKKGFEEQDKARVDTISGLEVCG